MPIRYMRAIVTIPKDTSVPEDACQNVWHFEADADVNLPYDDVVDVLTTFYTAIKDLYSPAIATAWNIRVYDLLDSPVRIPRVDETMNIANSVGTTPMLDEAAICSSFQGAEGSGINIRRRRGRVYIGPLHRDVGQYSGSRVEVTDAAILTIANAAKNVADNSLHAGLTQAVFSTTESPGTAVPGGREWTEAELAAGFNDVISGWVDNAFDIQRRRGIRADARSSWAL